MLGVRAVRYTRQADIPTRRAHRFSTPFPGSGDDARTMGRGLHVETTGNRRPVIISSGTLKAWTNGSARDDLLDPEDLQMGLITADDAINIVLRYDLQLMSKNLHHQFRNTVIGKTRKNEYMSIHHNGPQCQRKI